MNKLLFIILLTSNTFLAPCQVHERAIEKKMITVISNNPELAKKVKDRIMTVSPNKFVAMKVLQRNTSFSYPAVHTIQEVVKNQAQEREDALEEVRPGNDLCSSRTTVFIFMGATVACSTVMSALIAGATALTIHFTS